MTMPRFFSRVVDSLGPLLGGNVDPFDLLESEVVALRAPEGIEGREEHVQGFLLVANLFARLYPRLVVDADNDLLARVSALIREINPLVSLNGSEAPTAELAWCSPRTVERSVHVTAAGWNVIFEGDGTHSAPPISNPFTTLAAAALGAGELLRVILSPFLPADRQGPSTGAFNLLRWSEDEGGCDPEVPQVVDLGDLGLIGAGAIGQAVAYTLSRVAGLRGTLAVYDPEEVSTSNLQRYVLASDGDVGLKKATLVQKALAGNPLEVAPHTERWEQAKQLPPVLCVALDDPVSRIHLQSSLPRSVYNAWTQPDDFGWSIHERFGTGPCLACLYWPTRERPSYHQLIADSIGQNPIRVLGYLLHHVAIGQPLRDAEVPRIGDTSLPDGWQDWMERSLLEDLITRFPRVQELADEWRGKEIGDLYREGICGGALFTHVEADVEADVAVPLAHQSVLAGIMLALQVTAGSVPELSALRPAAPEGRVDVLRPFPQVVARPRAATPWCLCQDHDFRARYEQKWGSGLEAR